MAFQPPSPLELDAVRRKFIDLLVLQSTPFCNLDCSYCYLPNRTDRRRMELELLDRIFAMVLASPFVGPQLAIVWHAGEPLTLGTDYYRKANALIERYRRAETNVVQNFQTNGVLINDEWCAFFKEFSLRPGLSIDGPAEYHDLRRRYRNGKGSHAAAVRGLRALRRAGLRVHVISVVTEAALDSADAWFEFFLGEGIESVAFNVEEIEAANITSSLLKPDSPTRFRAFFRRFLERNETAGRPIELREFAGASAAIQHGCGDRHELEPLRILSVDVEGKAYTFSPELVGAHHDRYGDFSIGSMLAQDLPSLLASPALASQFVEIRAGVERCAATCSYFPWCGGGSPANKLFENGTFDSAETMFCRLTRQGVLEETLAAIERVLDRRPSASVE
jgi:uncharacterized protein